MGNLIKVLGKDLENCPHFFLDFESKSRAQNKGGWGDPINPDGGVTVLHQFGPWIPLVSWREPTSASVSEETCLHYKKAAALQILLGRGAHSFRTDAWTSSDFRSRVSHQANWGSLNPCIFLLVRVFHFAPLLPFWGAQDR